MSPLSASIHLVSTKRDRWLAMNVNSGCAFHVNSRTRILIEALQRQPNIDAAHNEFQLITGSEISPNEFCRRAHAIRSTLLASHASARDHLIFGFTLVPGRLFATLARPFQCLIGPTCLIATATLLPALLSLCLKIHPIWWSIGAYRQGILGFSLIVGSVFFHEIGHAAALLRFGRIVGRLGAGLNLVFPALYTEVLEHSIMDRHEKAWLNVSGVYFQALFAHLVVVAGIATGDQQLYSYATVIYLLAMFQLLPLNGQDGVWLISDLMPNHSRLFRSVTKKASVVLASFFAALLFCRVVLPYWSNQLSILPNPSELFSGHLGPHLSALASTFVLGALCVRLGRSFAPYMKAMSRRLNSDATTEMEQDHEGRRSEHGRGDRGWFRAGGHRTAPRVRPLRLDR